MMDHSAAWLQLKASRLSLMVQLPDPFGQRSVWDLPELRSRGWAVIENKAVFRLFSDESRSSNGFKKVSIDIQSSWSQHVSLFPSICSGWYETSPVYPVPYDVVWADVRHTTVLSATTSTATVLAAHLPLPRVLPEQVRAHFADFGSRSSLRHVSDNQDGKSDSTSMNLASLLHQSPCQ